MPTRKPTHTHTHACTIALKLTTEAGLGWAWLGLTICIRSPNLRGPEAAWPVPHLQLTPECRHVWECLSPCLSLSLCLYPMFDASRSSTRPAASAGQLAPLAGRSCSHCAQGPLLSLLGLVRAPEEQARRTTFSWGLCLALHRQATSSSSDQRQAEGGLPWASGPRVPSGETEALWGLSFLRQAQSGRKLSVLWT